LPIALPTESLFIPLHPHDWAVPLNAPKPLPPWVLAHFLVLWIDYDTLSYACFTFLNDTVTDVNVLTGTYLECITLLHVIEHVNVATDALVKVV